MATDSRGPVEEAVGLRRVIDPRLLSLFVVGDILGRGIPCLARVRRKPDQRRSVAALSTGDSGRTAGPPTPAPWPRPGSAEHRRRQLTRVARWSLGAHCGVVVYSGRDEMPPPGSEAVGEHPT